METKAVKHVITPRRISPSRELANKLISELENLSPGDTVEINARHVEVVTETFTEELVLVLFKERHVSKIQVRGTVPGMFSGISHFAELYGFVGRVESIPLGQR